MPVSRKIHPVIMYPMKHPKDEQHLKNLLDYIQDLYKKELNKYARPILVVHKNTYEVNPEANTFIDNKYKGNFEVEASWFVDTCQRWLTGLGKAYNRDSSGGDVYWLIPGDFKYDPDSLDKLKEIPEKVYEANNMCSLCLGEVKVSPTSSKQLIDTYGTFALLFNWFPNQAKYIKEHITNKPRTEFFAISRGYLSDLLKRRWYPYEQTIIILLEGFSLANEPNRKILSVDLGELEDEGQHRDSLSGAMQQVERTERLLKSYWREVHKDDRNWIDEFKILDHQSQYIRTAALVILNQLLSG